MPGRLRLVSGFTEQTAEGLIQAAVEALPPGASAQVILARASTLARDVVEVMRRDDEPAILASVALVIPDQAMKVAFLEAVGAHLI